MTTRLDDIRGVLQDKQADAVDAWTALTPGTRRVVMVGGVVAGVIILGLIAWTLWPSGSGRSLLDDPLTVARFINSGDFKALSADGRRPYMKAARKHQKQIADARRSEQIDRRTFRSAYLAAWLERRVDDMETYYAEPTAKRAAVLDEMLGYKPSKKPGTGTAAKQAAMPATKPKEKESDATLLYDSDADRQEFEAMKDRFEDDFLDAWPPQRKEQYKRFRSAYTERRRELEAAAAKASTGAG